MILPPLSAGLLLRSRNSGDDFLEFPVSAEAGIAIPSIEFLFKDRDSPCGARLSVATVGPEISTGFAERLDRFILSFRGDVG